MQYQLSLLCDTSTIQPFKSTCSRPSQPQPRFSIAANCQIVLGKFLLADCLLRLHLSAHPFEPLRIGVHAASVETVSHHGQIVHESLLTRRVNVRCSIALPLDSHPLFNRLRSF